MAAEIMLPEAFETAMLDIERTLDPEGAHVRADALMCELLRSLGYEKGVEVFENMSRWYG